VDTPQPPEADDPHAPPENPVLHLSHQALAEAREAVHRPDFRRSTVGAVLTIAALAAPYWMGWPHPRSTGTTIGSYASIAAFLLFGLVTARSLANEMARLVRPRGGPAVAGVLRLLITLFGYLIVLLILLDMVVSIKQLLVSGAITGVVVGIAAQQSLGNAFAGLVLLFSRPFAVGDTITLRSGAMGGQYDGEVTAITLMFTVLLTEEGPVSLPNSGVLASATGRRSPLTPATVEPTVEPVAPPVPEPPVQPAENPAGDHHEQGHRANPGSQPTN
jgi:small-conductance mechanosensitive channel